MANESTSPAVGIGKVVLKMTSGKKMELNNVLHVPDMRKNLVSGSKLTRGGFRMVFEAEKVIITKNRKYLGRGYLHEGLWKFTVQPIVTPVVTTEAVEPIIDNNNASTSVYIVESSNLWHDRLGHVNYGSIKRLVEMNLIPRMDLKEHGKCQICVEAKLTKKTI